MGLVFQIVDDVLDVTSTPEQLGKPIGSDSENGKTTFATLYGVDGAMAACTALNEKTCSALQRDISVQNRPFWSSWRSSFWRANTKTDHRPGKQKETLCSSFIRSFQSTAS